MILNNNEFNPEKTLQSSTNGIYLFFQSMTKQKPGKVVRKLFCIVEASHFTFNNRTRTTLPGYHLHFVLWSKNVSAARSFQWAPHLNLYSQTSITIQKEFYSKWYSILVLVIDLATDWRLSEKKIILRGRALVMLIGETGKKKKRQAKNK